MAYFQELPNISYPSFLNSRNKIEDRIIVKNIFKTTRDKYDILNENDSVLRIKTCACTGAAVNYTPDGMWNAYEKGQPVSVTLSLRFSELEPIFDTDYDDNEFNYSENRPDLRPVPIDAIGY